MFHGVMLELKNSEGTELCTGAQPLTSSTVLNSSGP